jgi:hypothetical protein
MKKQTLTILAGPALLVVASAVAAAAGSGLPGYALTASPSLEGIVPPQTASYNVTISAFNGWAGGVALSCRPSSPNIQCAVSPRLIGFGQYPPIGGLQTKQATLIAHAASGTPAGTYQVEVFGNAAEMSSSTTVELVVFQD